MVDPRKEDDDDGRKDPVEDKPPVAPPKRRRQRRHSKSRRERDNNTLDNAEDQEAHIEPTYEHDDCEDGQVNPDDPIGNEGSEDSNYLPISEEDESLGDEDFIVPEEPLEQERFKHRLIGTARSLKEKQQQLQDDQDLLNDRWTNVLAAEEYGLERPTKSYPKHKLLPQFDDEAPEPYIANA